uniref:CSON015012 protein n=1 Tax=Culicoides sonorensis TaxID=179676 RepID=A0A336MGD4_CULSO
MKFFIFFITLIVVTQAEHKNNNKKRSLVFHSDPQIISNHLQPISQTHFEQNPNGFYKFSYASPDGSRREESGSGLGGAVMQGSYAYISPDGTPVEVSYVADHNGFRPIGNVINREVQDSYFPEIQSHLFGHHELQKRQQHENERKGHESQALTGEVLRRSHRS